MNNHEKVNEFQVRNCQNNCDIPGESREKNTKNSEMISNNLKQENADVF